MATSNRLHAAIGKIEVSGRSTLLRACLPPRCLPRTAARCPVDGTLLRGAHHATASRSSALATSRFPAGKAI